MASCGRFQIHVIAVPLPADYHQAPESMNRPIQSLQLGDFIANLDVTAGLRNVLPDNSRQLIQSLVLVVRTNLCH
jgi:hypothetical protein